MQISTAQLFNQAVTSMLEKQADLGRTQEQLSTGQRILSPSDDPSASARILDLNKLIETNVQYQRNADFAETKLAMEETAIADITDILQRVRELSVQANNSSLSAEDRQAIAHEVRAHLDGILQQANSQGENGEYLFSGYRAETEPFSHNGTGVFTYAGDQGQKNLQIGANRQVATNDSGVEVFMRIENSTGGISSIFETVYNFAVDLEANTPSSTTITDIDNAIDNLMDIRSSVGARRSAIDSQRLANESMSAIMQDERSQLDNLDYAEAVSRFEQQLLALQASQQSFVKIEGLSLFNYL